MLLIVVLLVVVILLLLVAVTAVDGDYAAVGSVVMIMLLLEVW